MDKERRLFPRCRPEDVDVDPGGVCGFVDALDAANLETHAMLLVRRGRVFAEGYWAPYMPADRPQVYGLSAILTSAAVGLAVADGRLSYDDRLVDLFADVANVDLVGERAATIRVRDCLAMATGHASDNVLTPRLSALPGREPWAGDLCPEPEEEPGQTRHPNRWAAWTLAEIVRQSTGKDVHQLVSERILEPLGVLGTTWEPDAAGRILGHSGLRIAPEGMAAFLQLLLSDGVHNGLRLVPPEWVAEHGRRQVATDPAASRDWASGFGWQFWLNGFGGYRGEGAFGQLGIVLPEHDLVVVMYGQTDRPQAVLDAVANHLLPAVGRPETTSSAVLAQRLLDLRLRPVSGQRGAHVHLTFENRTNRWRLNDDEQGWLLRWVDSAGGDNTIRVAHGEWRRGVMRWSGRELNVAASGAWAEWGRFVVRVAALDSPHWIEVDLRDDGSGRLLWPFPPEGASVLAELAQPTL